MKTIRNKVANKSIAWNIVSKLFFLALLILPTMAYAIDLDTEISAEEKASFDQVLVPVLKIYNFVKYSASVIAVLALLFAGISYMMSGNDPGKRESSKNIAAYVIIGLVVIWAAPYVVDILI